MYSHSGQHVLIPAGARVLGETRPVQALGETRLAVAFHRLLMPDGSTRRLDQFLGLNQIGDAGLRDKVNHHYWSTFGAAAAVGLISGLAQWIGTAGFSSGTGDRTVIIAGGADAASQASLQVMSRFLNRLPTITIREGHRVKVYLTSDLQLPAYAGSPERFDVERSRRPYMMRRALVGAVVLVLVTTPRQRAVRRHRPRQPRASDPHRSAHAASLEELRAQYRTIVRMAQGLGRMDQYRTPPFCADPT